MAAVTGCNSEKKGNTYFKEGNYSEAIAVYEGLLSEKDSNRAKKKNQRLYERMGEAYCYLESYGSAVSCFEKADELSEDELSTEQITIRSFAYNELGAYYLKAEAYEEALEAFLAGLSLQPEESERESLLWNKMISLEHLARFSEAYEVCEDYLSEFSSTLKEEEKSKVEKEYEFLKTRIEE
jgi:tetratricopeptide (TPR) repeat protein